MPNPLTWLDRTVVDLGLALAEYTNNEKSDLLDTTDDDFELNSDDEMNSLLNFKFESAPLCKEDAGNPKKAQVGLHIIWASCLKRGSDLICF